MKRCAIYARFSSDLQRVTSLEDQIRSCRRFADQIGWAVSEGHVYEDAALSGFGVEHRPAYQRLLAAALAPSPPFSVIVVDDLSRLSRDLVETLRLYRRLRRHGVDLVSVADGINTQHQMAKLQITVKGLMNELYLDDLREKTHRGLTGRALHGLSTGGRLFGYRTVPQGVDGQEGAAWTVWEPEAEIVRRIFRLYQEGLSMKAIARLLNGKDVPFPAQATRRGPVRQGWAVSSVHTILTNEKYAGRWVWNKRAFVKDAETGKRTAALRPKSEWTEERRPDLRILDEDLWQAVHDRIATVRAAYGGTDTTRRPRGRAPEHYSPYLLSGLLHCAVCGARVTIQTSCRRKSNGTSYRYARYRCSFHVAKGPTVCANGMSIRQDALDAALLTKFRDAMTPDMTEYLVDTVNAALQQEPVERATRRTALAEERRRLDREVANLVAFITQGQNSSPRVRTELRVREDRLVEVDRELQDLGAGGSAPQSVDRSWVERQIEGLRDLLALDPLGARREIQKHVETLRIAPAPEIGERVVRITGRAKIDGLLEGQEAVHLQLVAGAGFEPATFGL